MQKLQLKFKNLPSDTSLVTCSRSFVLNREETLSVQNKVLDCNGLEENRPQHRGGSDLRVQNIVYVLNMRGQPLMPTTQQKSKKLLKTGKAKVVRTFPFTIKLNCATGEAKQLITLGIDPGYANIGFSAVSEKRELISGVLKLENRMSKRLQNRLMYRRNRRNRLWHRKPRFLNRVSTKKEGWLPPSTRRRLETHVKLVNQLKSMLPISKVVLEVANFDIQRIKNPSIQGTEYQQGNLYGYDNVRGYLIARENGKCQLCGKKKGTGKWRVHHIIQRKDRGSNSVSNLALLHESCHKKLHEQNLGKKLKKNKQYRDATFMNIIRWKLKESLEANITFGYITHRKILEQELTKSHVNDAFVIANGTDQKRVTQCEVIQRRKNNRCLQKNRKGFKPSIRRQRYKHRPGDTVDIENKKYEVVGIINYGKYITVKNNSSKKLYFPTKKIEDHFYNNGWQFIV